MDRVNVVALLDVSVNFLFICFASVVFGGGSTGQWWGGGSPSQIVYGFLGWSPCVGHFGNAGVGWVSPALKSL